jgi:hypothetical protein
VFKFKNIKVLGKKIFVVPVCLIWGFLSILSSPDFARQLQLRAERFPNAAPNINMLPDFIPQLFYQFFARHWLILLLIIVGIYVLSAVIKSDASKKVAIIASSITFSWFFFFVFLFFSGKTYYEGGFWLVHYDIHYSLQTSLLLVVAMIFGQIYQFLQEKYPYSWQKIITVSLLALILTSFVPFCLNVKYYKFKTTEIRRAMYIYDKMTLFYWYKNKVAKVPYLFAFPDIWAFSQHHNPPFYRDTKYRDVFHECYMATVYKDAENSGYYYLEPQKAYEKFYEEGGILTEEEITKSDFSKLYDKSFVLNQ